MSQIEKLAQEREIECKNCGAHFKIGDSVCPFCGSINDIGEELKYQEKLTDIRDNLDRLAALKREAYMREKRRNVKRIRKIAIIAGAVIAVLALVVFIAKGIYQNKRDADLTNEILWERETYAHLDELYSQGKYEEIARFYDDFYISNDYAKHSIANWGHSKFLEIYRIYEDLQRDMSFTVKYAEYIEDHKPYVFEGCVKLLMTDWEKADYGKQLTEADYAHLEEYREYARDILSEHFHMTEDDLVNLRKELFDDSISNVYPDGKMCSDKGKSLKWYD